MIRRSLALGLAVAALAPAAPALATDGQAASVGRFSRNLYGASAFRQANTSVKVSGVYGRLKPGQAYFTVAYANTVCDPAQAFPVGPFVADRNGFAYLNTTATAPAGLVGGTRSISVRRGDDQTDIDKDNITGPGDVVAVPGNPGVGLIECDSAPRTVSF